MSLMRDPSSDAPTWTHVTIIVVVSVVSATITTSLFVWLLLGGRRGIFWASFGSAQYAYFSIVIAIISLVICVVSLYRAGLVISICAPAFGGYVAGVIAYYFLAFESVERMVRANHIGFVAPLMLPTNVVFVAAGVGAGVLMLGFLMAYRSWYAVP